MAGKFDVVAAWSVDRLGRSALHLAQFVEEMRAAGVGHFLLKQGIDSETSTGRAMLSMCVTFAELERYVRDFLAAARELDTDDNEPDRLELAIADRAPELFQRRLEAQLRFKASEFRAEEEVRIYRHGRCRKFRPSRDGILVLPYEEIDIPNEDCDVVLVAGPHRDQSLGNNSLSTICDCAAAAGTKWRFRMTSFGEVFRAG